MAEIKTVQIVQGLAVSTPDDTLPHKVGTPTLGTHAVNLTYLNSAGIVTNVFTAVVAPTVNDDSGDGYSIGSMWINTVTDQIYQATDVTVGAAIWKNIADISSVQAFTNKTINADSNTITNIENADIKALAGIDATKIGDGSISNTEFQFLNNVASNIQTQFGGKQDSITGAATTITGPDLTINRAVISNASGKIAVSTTTDTELGYVSGVVSSIQTQFSGKQDSITGAATTITGPDLTINRAVISNASGKIAVSATTDTELGYVSGVVSSIQTQFSGKQDSITGAATTITGANLTINRALVSNGSGKVAVSTTTDTELGYVSGVTSAIQTQINNKISSPDQSFDLSNLSLSITASTGTITIAIKGKDGNDPSGTNIVATSFRNATATTGTYVGRTLTSALSMTLAGATTLGVASGSAAYVYVYLFDNAGTLTLGASLDLRDEGSLQSSSTTTTSNQVIYQASALTSKPVRLIGRFLATNTAGSWASPTEVSVCPFKSGTVGFRYGASTTAVGSTANAAIVFSTKHYDSGHNMYNSSTGTATVPIVGRYLVTAQLRGSAAIATGAINNSYNMTVQKNGSDHMYFERHADASATVAPRVNGSVVIDAVENDTVNIRLYNNWGASSTQINDPLYVFFSMIKLED